MYFQKRPPVSMSISQGSRKKTLTQNPPGSLFPWHVKNFLWEMREPEKQEHRHEDKVPVPSTRVSKGMDVRVMVLGGGLRYN